MLENLEDVRTLHFVVVPKLTNEPFFDLTARGCIDRAMELGNVVCHYIGTPVANPLEQANIISGLVKDSSKYNITQVDGIAVAVLDPQVTGYAINEAFEANIPVITFDADAPDSNRAAHISTDNYAFGIELGKVLLQLKPGGGGFGVITGYGPNLIDRIRGLRDRLQGSKWTEVESSPKNCENNITLSINQLYEFADDPSIEAIVPVGGWPMFDPDPTKWKEFVKKYPRVTTIVADSVDIQLELMNNGFVDGLVGQLPHQIGNIIAQVLFDINQGQHPESKIFASHLIEIMRHPLVLPSLTVDMHYLGSLSILAYVLFGIVSIQSVYLLNWTYKNRRTRVVRVSQPSFMAMICIGSLVLSSSLIPLAVDDEHYSQHGNNIACMSIPWLIVLGFVTAFSALSSKTWRVVQILHNAQRFERIRVSAHDVVKPYTLLLIVNIVVLLCWTFISPLEFRRMAHLGTDDWNRIISTYGECRSSKTIAGSTPFLVILTIVNVGLLAVANIQAYRSRSIHTEFSESRYVAIAMASMFQTFLIGVPMMFLVHDQPEAYFVVMCFLVFLTTMSIQLFMFLPKIMVLRDWEARKKVEGEMSIFTGDEEMRAVHMGSSVLVPHLAQRSRPGPKDYSNPAFAVIKPRTSKNVSKDASISRYSVPYESRCSFFPVDSRFEGICMRESSRIVENRSSLSYPEDVASELAFMMRELPSDAKVALIRRLEVELTDKTQVEGTSTECFADPNQQVILNQCSRALNQQVSFDECSAAPNQQVSLDQCSKAQEGNTNSECLSSEP